ncbi:unnamed protein product [Adineta ricciae]|uniref:Uncharacterized protein n=1 Tax=Adineta ricciae TaxID=249248 RepID=A0A815QUQ1_ADIRI|nr:unnamed protein product [Adineta ricciae]
MATGRTHCVVCGKEKATSKCTGCLNDFCYSHLGQHRQELAKELDEIEVHRDLFQQTLLDRKNNQQNHSLMKEIDQWEYDSIEKIRQKAKQTKEILLQRIAEHDIEIDQKLHVLTNQLRESRANDDITEIDLTCWKSKLEELNENLNKLPAASIRHTTMPLVNEIEVQISFVQSKLPSLNADAKWSPNGIVFAGGCGTGNKLNQLWHPYSLRIDMDDMVYISDYDNHRIVKWRNGDQEGQIVASRFGSENQNGQLKRPTDLVFDSNTNSVIIIDYGNRRVLRFGQQNSSREEVIVSDIDSCGLSMDKSGCIYVADYKKHEVRRWKIGNTDKVLVAGGNGMGDGLDQLDSPTHIFVDQDYALYVSDTGNHRVMKWMRNSKQGIIVAGGHGKGNEVTQLWNPRGIFVDELGTVYVADYGNHRIIRWLKGATEGTLLAGGNGPGNRADQLNSPTSLSFDKQGNLYVTDFHNHRVQKFGLN